MTTIADRNMGINKQAAVLLEALANEEPNCTVPDDMWFRTSPYGNCRERGFVLTIERGLHRYENLAFFEHRNSDELCCVRWSGRPNISGVYRYDDIDPKAYPDKWTLTESWPWMSIREAIQYVQSVIREIAAA